jgi:hypothetical protein
MFIKLIIGIVVAVAALVASLVVITLFPPILVLILAVSGIAVGWWGISSMRRRRLRFLSIIAICLSPTLVVAALAAAFAFSPISSQPVQTHGSTPIVVTPDTAP